MKIYIQKKERLCIAGDSARFRFQISVFTVVNIAGPHFQRGSRLGYHDKTVKTGILGSNKDAI
jgi:hypothetical protein